MTPQSEAAPEGAAREAQQPSRSQRHSSGPYDFVTHCSAQAALVIFFFALLGAIAHGAPLPFTCAVRAVTLTIRASDLPPRDQELAVRRVADGAADLLGAARRRLR